MYLLDGHNVLFLLLLESLDGLLFLLEVFLEGVNLLILFIDHQLALLEVFLEGVNGGSVPLAILIHLQLSLLEVFLEGLNDVSVPLARLLQLLFLFSDHQLALLELLFFSCQVAERRRQEQRHLMSPLQR